MALAIPAVQHSQRRRGGREDQQNLGKMLGESVNEIRVHRLQKKLQDLEAAATPNQKAIDSVKAKIDRLQGVTPEEKLRRRLQTAQVKTAETAAAEADAEAERAAQRHAVDMARGSQQISDAAAEEQRRQERHPRDLAAADAATARAAFDLESLKIDREEAERERQLMADAAAKLPANDGNTLTDLYEYSTAAAIQYLQSGTPAGLEMAKGHLETAALMHKMLMTIAGAPNLKPGDIPDVIQGGAMTEMVALQGVSRRIGNIQAMPPEQRYQAMVATFERLASESPPGMQETFKHWKEMWDHVDRGGRNNAGDEIITDEELRTFLTFLQQETASATFGLELVKKYAGGTQAAESPFMRRGQADPLVMPDFAGGAPASRGATGGRSAAAQQTSELDGILGLE